MKHKNLLTISLILLSAVLAGVTIIEPLTKTFKWLVPFTPTVVITGFFIFLVATSLFVFVIIKNIDKRD